MKKSIIFILLFIILICTSTQIDDNLYSEWKIENNNTQDNQISWAKFIWTNGYLGEKYFEKTAMLIPSKIKGVKNPVTFQFDLGCDVTGVYENTLRSILSNNSDIINQIKKVKTISKSKNIFENLGIYFGDYFVENKESYLFENYGEKTENINEQDTIHIGTIGRDLFKNQILIIDYPNTRFAITKSIPNETSFKIINIEIDKYGRIILPMKLNGKNLKILFDNGSSIFPLITPVKNISKFSVSNDIDTIACSSWGEKHEVTSKIIYDTFELAGLKFQNIKVYANHSGLGIDDKTDGMTGNILFWDKTIFIDFKNKKFGVKQN